MSEVGMRPTVLERWPQGGARLPAGPLAGLCPALAGFRLFGFQYENTPCQRPGDAFH